MVDPPTQHPDEYQNPHTGIAHCHRPKVGECAGTESFVAPFRLAGAAAAAIVLSSPPVAALGGEFAELTVVAKEGDGEFTNCRTRCPPVPCVSGWSTRALEAHMSSR